MFTTQVHIPKLPFTIDHSMRGLMLGSCFAEEIGMRLSEAKLPVVMNPNGILFNPASIGRVYDDITKGRKYTEDDLVSNEGLWHSMGHHGSFSAADKAEILEKINRPIDTRFDYIIVTLGTAWVYEYFGEVVANCHKIPASEFKRHRLSVAECVESLKSIAQSGIPVIITVSPVRHIKDGLTENTLSKSILRVAASELADAFPNVHYFPSYEILMDELRDYRYYADDMLHPSTVAVEYIWQKFSNAFFSEDTERLITKITKVGTALRHRPLHPDSAEYQKFRASTIATAKNIMELHPEIDFNEELASF